MSARLARLRDRPIAEPERRAALTLATVLLVGCAALLIATRPSSPHAPAPSRKAPHAATTADPPPAADPPTAGTSSAVVRLSREFLAGYLAYLYGHGSASEVRGASPALASGLRAHPPRISVDMRARHPRVVSVQAVAGEHGQLTATAMISDGGVANYLVTLLLERAGARLVVSGLGER
jgi:hypothetical protein